VPVGVSTRLLPGRRSGGVAVLAVVAVFGTLAIASFAWIYGAKLADGPPIRSDAMGYYLYLPAVLVDRDVTMERTAERSFAGRTSEMQGVRRVPPYGRYLDKYPVGEAIMLTPFFGLGHLAAMASGAERTGFSRPYQVAAASAGLVFALLGVMILGFFLLRLVSTGSVVITLLAIVLGTNLFHYATFDAVFSHAFSFFLVTVSVVLAVALYERPRFWRAVALGLSTGLVTAVRPSNAVVLVFASLVGVVGIGDVRRRLRSLWYHRALVTAGSAAFLLAILPQLAYWHAITGKVYVYTYGNEHLDLLHPHLVDVLFSVRKGLFFWTPVLVLAVIGLPLLRRVAPELFLASVAFLALDTWAIASWDVWWYGGSLGQRPFVEALPVFALGLASLTEAVRAPLARGVSLVVMIAASLLAIHSTVAYWRHVIPYDGTTWDVYVESFRRTWGF
jgi:hypothetical protein